jgi:hypothetical protein
MNSPNPLTSMPSHEEDSDSIQIDLWKIIDFFIQQYRRLILGAGLGLILGLVGWLFLGAYKAEVIVPNQWGEVISVRALEISWASLAREIAAEPGLSLEEASFYKSMSSMSFWEKVLKPSYAVTKSDLKDLVLSPEIKGAPIINFEISLNGKDTKLAEKQLLQIVQFMRNSSSYLAVQNIITSYENENFLGVATIEKDLNAARLQLISDNRRLVNLEELQKRFPGNSLVTNQVVDLKESGAKYLPISTQIIAAKSDIFSLQERIQQLQTRFEQAQLLTQFVSQAKPLVSKERNGVQLAEQLLAIEAQMRKTTSMDSVSQLVVLDRIRLDLLKIQVQFLSRVDQPLIPIVQRSSSWIAASVGGLFGGFFIALLISLGLQYWLAYKVRLQSAKSARLEG